MAYISLKEYADMHGRSLDTMRQSAARGRFQTARKIGRNWVIDEAEPLIDGRVKSGQYVDWRKDKKGRA